MVQGHVQIVLAKRKDTIIKAVVKKHAFNRDWCNSHVHTQCRDQQEYYHTTFKIFTLHVYLTIVGIHEIIEKNLKL